MMTVRIADIFSGTHSIGSTLRIQGWVRTRRDSKAGLSFVNVHDGSCFDPLQVIAPSTLENYADEIQRLSSGCSVQIEGILKASEGKGQSVELEATSVSVVGWVDDPKHTPCSQRHSMEFLRTVAHLRPRTNLIGAVTRVRHCLSQAVHRFFDERGFYWIHTPHKVQIAKALGNNSGFRH